MWSKKKKAWIFVLRHYLILYLKAHSFPQAFLSENCWLPGEDYVHEQNDIRACFCAKWRLLLIYVHGVTLILFCRLEKLEKWLSYCKCF